VTDNVATVDRHRGKAVGSPAVSGCHGRIYDGTSSQPDRTVTASSQLHVTR
jgi:hypothetical protein